MPNGTTSPTLLRGGGRRTQYPSGSRTSASVRSETYKHADNHIGIHVAVPRHVLGQISSPEEIQEVRSRWTACFDRLTEQGKAKAGLSLTNEGKIVSGKKGRSVADGPCRSQGRFRFTILEKTARIEIRFDPHRTSTLQLALPSHFTRRGFEYQMQGSFGRIVALATRRRVLVGSGETGLRN